MFLSKISFQHAWFFGKFLEKQAGIKKLQIDMLDFWGNFLKSKLESKKSNKHAWFLGEFLEKQAGIKKVK